MSSIPIHVHDYDTELAQKPTLDTQAKDNISRKYYTNFEIL